MARRNRGQSIDFYYKPHSQLNVEVLNSALVVVSMAEVMISVMKSKGIAVIWVIIAVEVQVAIMGSAV